MRLHLPALLAVLSTVTYAACGSSDESKSVPVGGAGGEGGEAPSTGGKSSAAGSLNGGGDLNTAGQLGLAGLGGQGLGGSSGGEPGGAGAGAGASSNAAGDSQGGAASELALPAECPGARGDYKLIVGTEQPDTFSAAKQSGKVLVFGLGGNDVFEEDQVGGDCIVGGPGFDSFTSPDQQDTYFFGGPGDDEFHITNDSNHFYVADLGIDDDSIGLSHTAFPFLSGSPGSGLRQEQLLSLPGYSTGNASIPADQNYPGAIVYDPSNGQLWSDTDRGDDTTGAKQIGTIMSYSSYTFSLNTFRID